MIEKEVNEKPGNAPSGDIKYQFAGWILFIVCAVFFIASSLKNGDTLTFIGSIIFLVACIAFIIPLVMNMKHGFGDKKT